MSLVTINWLPSKKDLRQFGVTMLVASSLFSVILYWQKHQAAALTVISIGLILFLSGLSGTKLGKWFYTGWMALAFVMGNVMSHLILALFYFLILTPISLIFKVIGRDILCLKRQKVASYWAKIDYVVDKRINEHQY